MPMILVPKKDGAWRMCMNCRSINNITIRYRHPIPHLDYLLDELHEVDTIKLGLTNALTFMRLMNHILRSLIGKCVVVYFDDIFIYLTCLNDHLLHVKNVDDEKVKAIQDWPTHKIIGESQERAFQALKERLTQALILSLPNLSKSFKLECDVSSVGIGAVILQEGH
ncbi:hypothetical protein CR513_11186, partial [Mucuna pruriens]